jgi:hypothetical protein
VISSADQQKDADAALLAAMVDSSMGMISLPAICAAAAGEKPHMHVPTVQLSAGCGPETAMPLF